MDDSAEPSPPGPPESKPAESKPAELQPSESKPPGFTPAGFAKQFVAPALAVFLAPTLSYLFFDHAEATFDAEAREEMLAQIDADRGIAADERAEAREFFRSVPLSEILVRNPGFAENLDPTAASNFWQFRWAKRLALWSLVGGALVFAAAGVAVLLSMRSQRAQCYSLSIGWQLLRLYSATQAVVQGVLLVALSFWVTALWGGVYFLKLIGFAGLVAAGAVFVVLAGVFKRIDTEFRVDGEALAMADLGPLAERLRSICERVGTAEPDHVVVGIDDNFFVTEQPVLVGDRELTGRTLFVSLSLLKQLDGDEADAVMAHEMAHFSGQDTYYSGKIAPLIARFDAYLQALSENPLTLPIFWFMHCFRAMFELSLSRVRREREHRADRIAAETTSPDAIVGALLRIVAYSLYRQKTENELFDVERALDDAPILSRLDAGFHRYAVGFVGDADPEHVTTSHPFDSHPPLAERLAARGRAFESPFSRETLAAAGDGHWLRELPRGAERERSQWDAYEQRFREFHAQTLPYRYLPSTPQEAAVVAEHFPEVTFEGKKGPLTMDHQGLSHPAWETPLAFGDVKSIELSDSKELLLHPHRGKPRKLMLKAFDDGVQPLTDAIGSYYGRHLSAKEYAAHKAAQAEAAAPTGDEAAV